MADHERLRLALGRRCRAGRAVGISAAAAAASASRRMVRMESTLPVPVCGSRYPTVTVATASTARDVEI